jgi:hypothetical protein
MGSVQRLSSGATLIGFGAAGRLIEVASNQSPVWTATLVLNGSPVSFYRSIRIVSLYEYATP